MFFSVLCLLCLCARLFICALWSPAWKGLTSWLSFVVSNSEFVTFPLVRCGTWLYRFLIFAPLLTFTIYRHNTNKAVVACFGDGESRSARRKPLQYKLLWNIQNRKDMSKYKCRDIGLPDWMGVQNRQAAPGDGACLCCFRQEYFYDSLCKPMQEMWPPEWAHFGPRSIVWTNLVEVH